MKKTVLTFLLFLIPSLGHATTWYACSGGGNWNGASVWTSVSADQVGCTGSTGNPVAGDTAILNSSSGNITVSATPSAAVLNMTGYTGTLALVSYDTTISGLCTLQGTITVSSGYLACNGGVTLAGVVTTSISLIIEGTGTLTSNGYTWPGSIKFLLANQVITLSGNWITTGLTSFGSTAQLNYTTNETFTANGGITMSAATIANANSATIILGGGTWSGTSIMNNNLTLAGNVTISTTVEFGTGTLLYSSGTITTTGGTLIIQSSSTLNTAGMSWNTVEWQNNMTQTLASALTANTLYSAGASITFAGNFNMTTQILQIYGSNTNQIFTLVSGTTIYVTNAISIINLSFRSSNVQLNTTTASSPAYLVYTGTVANENTEGMSMTDIFASAPTIPFYGPKILNWNGGTLTRTQGISNVTAANINKKPTNYYTGT